MIKIIKATPITFNGEDCLEVLIEDSRFVGLENCEACLYREDTLDLLNGINCMDAHGCSMCSYARFIRLPLNINLPNLNLQ